MTAAPRIGMHSDELHESNGVRPDAGARDTAAVFSCQDDAGRGVLPAACKQLVSREVFVWERDLDERSQVSNPRGGPWDDLQNSVSAASFSAIALYSGLCVSGIRDMSLPMFPVTFTRPCMKAALASSSPLVILVKSS